MKRLVTILLVLTMSATAYAWLIDWSDAASREEMQEQLEKIDQLFQRQENIREFLTALSIDDGFTIGVLANRYPFNVSPRLSLYAGSRDMAQEAIAAKHFLNELLEITQSKLDSLMEIN